MIKHIPSALDWLKQSAEGRAWHDALPQQVEHCAKVWALRLDAPFQNSFVSLVVPTHREDGTRAVLKLQFPDRESQHEAAALRLWNGQGASRLYEHDPSRHALLIEHCLPGAHLSSVGLNEALDVFVHLLPRISVPAAAPFQTLANEAQHWAATLETQWESSGRPFDRRLLNIAQSALRELPLSQGEQVLVHQDLHAQNVLSAEREAWLAIDPKPLIGEREFAIAPMVRSFELGHSRQDVLRRFDRLTSDLALDRQRARLWTVAQTIAWCFGSAHQHKHLQTVTWLLDASNETRTSWVPAAT